MTHGLNLAVLPICSSISLICVLCHSAEIEVMVMFLMMKAL